MLRAFSRNPPRIPTGRSNVSAHEQLRRLFFELLATPSPSGQEAACAAIVRRRLEELGLDVLEDEAGVASGGDVGNLYCRLAPTADGGVPIFLCAHLDTVPPVGAIRPVLRRGVVRNAEPTILGADNKAALATMIDAIRVVRQDDVSHAGVELVLTVGEEVGLRGAKFFDARRLKARIGVVYDHSGPIGGVVIEAPSRTTVHAVVIGRAAHAGIEPAAGRSAIMAAARGLASLEHGARQDEATLNAGLIRGGTAANVVADRCLVELEVRSRDDDHCQKVVAEVIAAMRIAADEERCEIEIEAIEQYHAYRLEQDEPVVSLATAALLDCGFAPRSIATGGGSDAHIFCGRGRRCVNLTHGVEGFHSRDEHVAMKDLVAMRDVTLALINRAALSTLARARTSGTGSPADRTSKRKRAFTCEFVEFGRRAPR